MTREARHRESGELIVARREVIQADATIVGWDEHFKPILSTETDVDWDSQQPTTDPHGQHEYVGEFGTIFTYRDLEFFDDEDNEAD